MSRVSQNTGRCEISHAAVGAPGGSMGAVVRVVFTPTPGDVQGVNMALAGGGYRGLDSGRLGSGVAREQRREEDITLRSGRE